MGTIGCCVSWCGKVIRRFTYSTSLALTRGVSSMKQNLTWGASRNPWPVHLFSCLACAVWMKQNLTWGTNRNPWPVHLFIHDDSSRASFLRAI